MNWDDLRIVLAVARHGSHSAAARALGLAQPTIGRRMRGLEESLGAPLFERSALGLKATALGRSLLAEIAPIEERVLAAERIVDSGASRLEGEVRVTASDWLAVRVLPAALADVAARTPELRVDLVAGPGLASLTRNETDIALRPRRFEANGVYQRAIGRVDFALYTSRTYLAKHGEPTRTNGGAGHSFVSMDDDEGAIADVDWLRRTMPRARIAMRANGREPLAALAARGVGVACLPSLVGDAVSGLVKVTSVEGVPARTLWLGVHRDRRALPRVAAVVEAVREHVAATLAPVGAARH